MSGVDRKGRWPVPRETQAIAVMGGCQLDLREADMTEPDILVTAVSVMGSVVVVVPEGMRVELEGLAVMGTKECKLADVPVRPDLPG
jgi:predicted membrane protein